MRNRILSFLVIIVFIFIVPVSGQISPGPLVSAHSHLEGLTNCTHCHTLGAKVSNDKCLACHLEVKARVDQKKGYHSSAEVQGKTCTSCHNDHHGTTFRIIRFNTEKFDHRLTGFGLTGVHAKKLCKDCHKAEFITSKTIKTKKYSYLGLTQECGGCHTDYHQKTLAATCSNCHGNDAFKPAVKFDHLKAKFQLTGKHQSVECIKCHKVTTKEGKKFQEFTGISFQSCSNCHTDPHHGQFGPKCNDCHSTESFHSIKGISNFDHSKTAYKLVDKHLNVACKSCHKNKVTDPVKHERCTDCHVDYHNSQFAHDGSSPDCSQCHSTKGFPGAAFSIEQHNTTANFKLQGSHLATPCFACHKKQEKWNFRQIGIKCNDCHENIHAATLDKKYISESGCEKCHVVSAWNKISFNHSETTFPLFGVHVNQTCRACHFNKEKTGHEHQQFSNLSKACSTCHTDQHNLQFEVDGITDCGRCHGFEAWKIDRFDHNKTNFKLDVTHRNVPCLKCHKTIKSGQNSFVLYKIKETKCENCH